MTPPHFHLDDEVEVIGTETRFKISQIQKNPNGEIAYSAVGEPYYPASSLRLVEELQVDDWVEVIGKPDYFTQYTGKMTFKITKGPNECGGILGFGGVSCGGEYFGGDGTPFYPPRSLRKLTPDEIAKHLASPTNTPQNKFNEKTEARLSVIESRLDALGPSHAELLGDVEAIAERIAANEKRLDILEGEQPEVIDALQKAHFAVDELDGGRVGITYSMGGIKLARKILDGMETI